MLAMKAVCIDLLLSASDDLSGVRIRSTSYFVPYLVHCDVPRINYLGKIVCPGAGSCSTGFKLEDLLLP